MDGKLQFRCVEPPNSLDLKHKCTTTQVEKPVEQISNDMQSLDSIEKLSSVDLTCDIEDGQSLNRSQDSVQYPVEPPKYLDVSPNVNGHKIPSYVGISCAISGYTNFSRYCGSARNSCSRGNSPITNRIIEPVIIDNNNYNHNDDDNVQSNNINGLNQTNGVRGSIETPQVDSKSLIQQRIESLYGESFAVGWRDSRRKNKQKSVATNIKKRSPSCPAQTRMNTSPDVMKKSPPVFKHVDKNFLDQLQIEKNDSENKEAKEKNRNTITDFNSSPVCAEVSHEVKDGVWFLNKLNLSCENIETKIKRAHEILEADKEKISEEISGKILSAIGKANLLLSKKLNQFRELCWKNINHDEEELFQTKNEDLMGFWDMTVIQIDHVNDTLDEIVKLRGNNWEISNEVNQIPKTRSPRKAFTPKSSPNRKTNVTSGSESTNSREEARRNRLKEAKRRLAANKAANNDNSEITIFMPPKGNS